MELQFFSAYCLMMLDICSKFMKITQRVSELLSRHDFVTDRQMFRRTDNRRPGRNKMSSRLNLCVCVLGGGGSELLSRHDFVTDRQMFRRTDNRRPGRNKMSSRLNLCVCVGGGETYLPSLEILAFFIYLHSPLQPHPPPPTPQHHHHTHLQVF